MHAKAVTDERGFSLIELLVAILITLIISGSIYGLLAQGQNAFRREPEISDRQQQVRVAMDLIQRDLATAGMGMPEWVQAFTPGLDGAGGTAPTPSQNAQGQPTDYLEIFGNDGSCPSVTVCGVFGAGVAILEPTFPSCYRFPQPLILVPGRGGAGASIGFGFNETNAGGCGNTAVNFPPGQEPAGYPPGSFNPPPGLVALNPNMMGVVQIVRYQIVVDANNIPSLWRSTTGGLDLTAGGGAPPFVDPGAGGDWQLIATGIEDLQVYYRNGDGAWQDDPGVVTLNLYNTIVREAKVTLGARTTGQQQLQGESQSVAGIAAIRGQLTSVTSPRAALSALSVGPPVGDPQRWE